MATLSANSSDRPLIFGHIGPQETEESTNTSVPGPELVVNVTDEIAGNAPPEPRLPYFTVGVTQADQVATVKDRKLRKALTTGGSASAGDSGIGGIMDQSNPEVTFQFGSLSPLDVTAGSTSGPIP